MAIWTCGQAAAQGVMVGCGDQLGEWTWLLGGATASQNSWEAGDWGA